MNIQTMKRRRVEELVLALAIVIATGGCAERHLRGSSDSGAEERDAGRQPSQEERDAWEAWQCGFIDVVCRQNYACGIGGGFDVCSKSGEEAAKMALCDTAVNFYIANRKELDECISKYPTDCSVTASEACPLATGDKEFETICQ